MAPPPLSDSLKPRLFILSFSHLPTDGRVLRQIKALAPHFAITAAGIDDDPSSLLPGISLHFVPLRRRRSAAGKFLRTASYLPGVLFPRADFWPWSLTSEYRMARQALDAQPCDLMLCNDLSAVLLGVENLRKRGIPFVADYHEFPAGEATEQLRHRWLTGPHGHRCLRRYGRLAAGSMTVNEAFAETFRRVYGFESTVVLNAPELQPLPETPPRTDSALHLIYHGSGGANRNLDVMIRAAGKMKRPVKLHLMLVEDESWLRGLRALADAEAPGRVEFLKPVAPEHIAATVARCDVGLFLVESHSFNNQHALPNKLFEYVHGGLAVCSSSSPALRQFIAKHQNGWLLQNVDSTELAELLDGISAEELAQKKQASLQARECYHAGNETRRMVELLLKITGRSTPAGVEG